MDVESTCSLAIKRTPGAYADPNPTIIEHVEKSFIIAWAIQVQWTSKEMYVCLGRNNAGTKKRFKCLHVARGRGTNTRMCGR